MVIDYKEDRIKSSHAQLNFYCWSNITKAPSIIYFSIHGLMMQGKSYQCLAEALFSEPRQNGVLVAPDIFGFGQSYSEGDQEVDYKKSLDGLHSLLTKLKTDYPGTPIVCIGESLGAHLARRLVGMYPDMFAGLILSSPCLRPKMITPPLIPHAVKQVVLSSLNPQRELDLEPFARRFLVNEPENLKNYIDEPLNRKSLDLRSLLKSVLIVSTVKLGSVSKEVPILVLRGKKDCVCSKRSSEKFLSSLNSESTEVQYFEECGHLILQAGKINKKVISSILRWTEPLTVW